MSDEPRGIDERVNWVVWKKLREDILIEFFSKNLRNGAWEETSGKDPCMCARIFGMRHSLRLGNWFV